MNLFRLNKRDLFLCLCTTIFLMIGQLTNVYKAAPEKFFERGIALNSDGYVIGKIAISEQEGVFKNITALSQVLPNKRLNQKEQLEHLRSFYTLYSRDAYLNKTKIKRHVFYLSKTALHSFFYNLGNWIFSPDPEFYLKAIIFQKTLLFSLVLSLIVVWVSKMVNIYSAILLAISLALCPIVILSARCYWYAPFTWYVPFLTACYFLHKDYRGITNYKFKHTLIVGASFLFHMLFHSFEFISSHLVTVGMPFLFYGILKGDFKQFFTRSIGLVCVAVVAIFISVFLVLLQFKVAEQTTFSGAIEYVHKKFVIRTSGERDMTKSLEGIDYNLLSPKEKNIVDAAKITRLELIGNLMDRPALAIYDKNDPVFGVYFKGYFWLISLCSGLLLIMSLLRKVGDTRLAIALIVSSWVSLLGPISWWVIFKDHSFWHQHLVVYLWYLPYLIFGFMLVGYVLKEGIDYGKLKLARN